MENKNIYDYNFILIFISFYILIYIILNNLLFDWYDNNLLIRTLVITHRRFEI